jgi:import inner membrane translocase subunit TIM10
MRQWVDALRGTGDGVPVSSASILGARGALMLLADWIFTEAFVCPILRRMVGSCYDKCMDKRYKDGDLSVGENTCLDRCASKYWATTSIVGQLLGASQGR